MPAYLITFMFVSLAMVVIGVAGAIAIELIKLKMAQVAATKLSDVVSDLGKFM